MLEEEAYPPSEPRLSRNRQPFESRYGVEAVDKCPQQRVRRVFPQLVGDLIKARSLSLLAIVLSESHSPLTSPHPPHGEVHGGSRLGSARMPSRRRPGCRLQLGQLAYN